MCYRMVAELRGTRPAPTAESGSAGPGPQRADSATMKKRTLGRGGGCGARPCRRCRVYLERLLRRRRPRAQSARGGGQRVVPVAVAKAGKAASRCASRRWAPSPPLPASRSSRGSTARSSACISPTAHGSRRATCCSPSTAARSRPRSSASRRSSPAPRRSSSRRSATCSATPIWSPGTPPPWSRSTTPGPRSTSRAPSPSPTRRRCENLKVQLGYCTIRAPISGRISMATVKVGNIVRQADAAPLATINQIAPIYVSFTVPQRSLPDVRAGACGRDRHGRRPSCPAATRRPPVR